MAVDASSFQSLPFVDGQVESVDAANNMVTLSDGAGHSAPVEVVDPRARERLETPKPGEMVVITYT